VGHWIKDHYVTAVSNDVVGGVHRSEQSCLLIGLSTTRSHQLANTGHYCEQNNAAQRPLCGVRWLTNCWHGNL